MAKILVVDDEPDGRQVVAVYLRRLGYFVAEAAGADQGMRRLLDDWPDAVVLDVRMPGISGVDMLEVIRSYTRWQSLPVFIVTAHATPDEIRRAREQGVVEVFEKSGYRLDELGDALAAAVSAAVDGTGLICTLLFDRPLTLAGSPPYGPMDGSILFDGRTPESVEHNAPDTLAFFMTDPVQGGSSWEVGGQPAWVITPLAVPQNRTL